MAYRDPGLLHVDRDLSNISAGYGDGSRQVAKYVSQRLFLPTRVEDKSDKWKVYNRDVWGRQTGDLRAPGARANELPPTTLSRDSYYTQEHALVSVVPLEDDANSDGGFSELGRATAQTSNTILLNRELTAVTLATTAANYASGFTTTLSGTAQWNDYTNSNPVSDSKVAIDAIEAAIGEEPNGVIMGRAVWRQLEDHPKVLERLKVGNPVKTTLQIIQDIFDLPTIYVSTAAYLNSVYGAAETVAKMWGKDVLYFYNPPSLGNGGGTGEPAYGAEFVRPVVGTGDMMPTERQYEWDRKANKVRVSREYQLRHFTVDGSSKSNGPGYLIKAAIA